MTGARVTATAWAVWSIDEDTGCAGIVSGGPEGTAVAAAKRWNSSARHVKGLRYEALPAGQVPAGTRRVTDLPPRMP